MIFIYLFALSCFSSEIVFAESPPRCTHNLCNDKNATYKACPNPCPGTCKNPPGVENCLMMCKEFGCECKPGYVLSDNGKCILLKDCPGFDICNDNNATFKECPNPCPGTCDNPPGVENCLMMCDEFGCECNPGYVLSDNGMCILLKDCPDYLRCNWDRNTTYKECPNPCPRTCKLPGGSGPCREKCPKEGCECKEGFYLNKEGKCVKLQDCDGARTCSSNETFVFCNVACPSNRCPIDDSRAIAACSPPFPCPSGCSCKRGHLRNPGDDRCILASDCPPVKCTRPNEEWNSCPPPCFTDRCSDIGKVGECDTSFFSCWPQCVCMPGFCRNDENICVPEKKRPPKCGYNEMAVKCRTICPPQSCEIAYTEYACGNQTCEPGCDCLPNYLRNASGICIPNEECPPPPTIPTCGDNEELSKCKIVCPPQSCESIYTQYLCVADIPCEWGCNCVSGYLRNSDGVCIPSEKCPSTPTCDVPKECRSTCANPNPANCPPIGKVLDNQDGCKCKPGYILSDKGICIRIEDCPADKGCNGDLNAIATKCPWPCPSTCDSPNAGSCDKICIPVDCQCKPGFILNKKNGKCILPNKCKGGNPCGVNGTFSDCAFYCPYQDCPRDDRRRLISCKPGRPCPSGCMCKDYYKRETRKSDKCVLASDCAPVRCTRPNEKWNPCASECLVEKCSDINKNSGCIPDPKNCQPKCVCYDGYYRNETGYCVPKNQCKSPCPTPRCRPTCAVPNPPDCPFIEPGETNDDSCNCRRGFILSEAGGQCIRVLDCPTSFGCNGDKNAIVKECPLPCPSTCAAPNAVQCKRMCDPIGCECKPGYILSALGGNCIKPDSCEGGHPCGPNATFVNCKYVCRTSFCPVDDTRVVPICEKHPVEPCLSGCVCSLNHLILSRDNPICIRSDECPPVDCKRPHEIWDSCPNDCQSEYCNVVDTPPVICNTLVLNCNPQCRCEKGYFRNPKTDICVCPEECRELNVRKRSNN